MIHGLSLATITGKWWRKTPFVQICMVWALACPEMVGWINGCQIVKSVTIELLTTEANDQSSLHCVVVSTGAMSDHIGYRDASSGGGCSKSSACMGQFIINENWKLLHVIQPITQLSVKTSYLDQARNICLFVGRVMREFLKQFSRNLTGLQSDAVGRKTLTYEQPFLVSIIIYLCNKNDLRKVTSYMA